MRGVRSGSAPTRHLRLLRPHAARIGRASGARAPAALELTDEPYADGRFEWELDFQRFDARSARRAFFVYPDTALGVAWWWEWAEERRFGVGNKNQAAAFYIEGVVRGERLEGELLRWRYDDEGRPVEGPDSWQAPVSGRRVGC